MWLSFWSQSAIPHYSVIFGSHASIDSYSTVSDSTQKFGTNFCAIRGPQYKKEDSYSCVDFLMTHHLLLCLVNVIVSRLLADGHVFQNQNYFIARVKPVETRI